MSKINIRNKDFTIFGIYDTDSGKVELLSNSLFSLIESNSLDIISKDKRLYLKNNGYVQTNKLVKNHTFENINIAANAMLGKNVEALDIFYTIDNVQLCKLTKSLFNYNDQITKKEFIEKSYARNRNLVYQALSRDDFKCQLNTMHETFKTKDNIPYMECHHLVPLSMRDRFSVNLDVLENLVCLCPVCHRKLHYGLDIHDELLKLYLSKKEELEKVGIILTLDELESYYK